MWRKFTVCGLVIWTLCHHKEKPFQVSQTHSLLPLLALWLSWSYRTNCGCVCIVYAVVILLLMGLAEFIILCDIIVRHFSCQITWLAVGFVWFVYWVWSLHFYHSSSSRFASRLICTLFATNEEVLHFSLSVWYVCVEAFRHVSMSHTHYFNWNII